jgi:phage-related protein
MAWGLKYMLKPAFLLGKVFMGLRAFAAVVPSLLLRTGYALALIANPLKFLPVLFMGLGKGLAFVLSPLKWLPVVLSTITTLFGFLFSPIVIVVAALALLVIAVAGISGSWKGFIQLMKVVWKTIKEKAVAGFYYMKKVLQEVWAWMKPIWEQMKETAVVVLKAILEMVVEMWGAIKGAFKATGSAIASAWKSFWGSSEKTTEDSMTNIKNTIISALDDISFYFKNWKLVTTLAVTGTAKSVVGVINDFRWMIAHPFTKGGTRQVEFGSLEHGLALQVADLEKQLA